MNILNHEIVVEYFHPKDEIGSDHIQVRIYSGYASLMEVRLCRPKRLLNSQYTIQNMEALLKYARNCAQKNGFELIAVMSDNYDRRIGVYRVND